MYLLFFKNSRKISQTFTEKIGIFFSVNNNKKKLDKSPLQILYGPMKVNSLFERDSIHNTPQYTKKHSLKSEYEKGFCLIFYFFNIF